MRASPWPLLLFYLLSGCGGTVSRVVTSSPGGAASNLSSEFTYYHALGDSITAGYALQSPSTQRYPELVATSISLPLIDNAVSGDQACDVPGDQIVGVSESPSLAARGLYSLLISTNDVDVKGAGAYEQVFNTCHQATIAWLALPSEYKVLATDPSVKSSGQTHLESFWNALTTDAANASLMFSITSVVSGPIYVWYRITDGNLGVVSYAVDGKQIGSLTHGMTPLIATQNKASSSLGFLRINSVAAGSHTVTFTQTSIGSNGFGVVAVGTLPPAVTSGLPRVLVGTTPKQNSQAAAVCTGDDAICQAYIQDIKMNVAIFASDGLGVFLFDTRKHEVGTYVDTTDTIHPNALGHQEINQAVLDAIAVF